MSKGGRGLGRLLREERKGDHARRACKRTAAQDRHMAEELLPALGLYLPCAMARKCGGKLLREKGWGRQPHKAKEGAIYTHCWT